MLKLTAQLELSGPLRRRLDTLSGLPGDVAREVARAAAPVLQQEARANLHTQSARTLGKRSGKLLAATRAEFRETAAGGEVALRTLFYGRVNARGAVITPKNGLYLTLRVGNRFFRKRRVVIPARDWDVLALERTRARVPDLSRAATAKVWKGQS